VGRYAAHVDLRWLAAASFAVMGLVCFRFGGFTTDVNFATIALAELMLGLGVALFFMPVLTILLSDLEGAEIAEGSGSATFLRTIGASFAVSITTYLWARGSSAGHAHLAEFINPFNASAHHALTASRGAMAQHAAAINRSITQQATQISFNHIFDGLGALFFVLIVVVWLAKPPFIRGSGGKTGGH
jgi:DHA2 family multidrug resistance protein